MERYEKYNFLDTWSIFILHDLDLSTDLACS